MTTLTLVREDTTTILRGFLADGRIVDVLPLLYGGAVNVGPAGSPFYDDRWDYDDYAVATLAAIEWDGEGEPQWWIRHLLTGRRRSPSSEEQWKGAEYTEEIRA